MKKQTKMKAGRVPKVFIAAYEHHFLELVAKLSAGRDCLPFDLQGSQEWVGMAAGHMDCLNRMMGKWSKRDV